MDTDTAGRISKFSKGLVERLDPAYDYNLRHFRLRHMAAELLRSLRPDGVLPGRGPRLRSRVYARRAGAAARPAGPVLLIHLVSYT